MKKSSKNNNLDNYRKRLAEENELLVKRSIAHIQSLSGVITFSSVSKVSYELADIANGKQGITTAGISKNPIYRALVENAKSVQQTDPHIIKKRSKYSMGDLHLSLHALRVENEQLKHKNKILTLKLKETPDLVEGVAPIREEILEINDHLKLAAKAIVHRLQELELAYIDTETKSLVLAHFGEIIVHRGALELFYRKELDAINH